VKPRLLLLSTFLISSSKSDLPENVILDCPNIGTLYLIFPAPARRRHTFLHRPEFGPTHSFFFAISSRRFAVLPLPHAFSPPPLLFLPPFPSLLQVSSSHLFQRWESYTFAISSQIGKVPSLLVHETDWLPCVSYLELDAGRYC